MYLLIGFRIMIYSEMEMKIIFFNCMDISEVKKASAAFITVMCEESDTSHIDKMDEYYFLRISLLIDDELKNDIE